MGGLLLRYSDPKAGAGTLIHHAGREVLDGDGARDMPVYEGLQPRNWRGSGVLEPPHGRTGPESGRKSVDWSTTPRSLEGDLHDTRCTRPRCRPRPGRG